MVLIYASCVNCSLPLVKRYRNLKWLWRSFWLDVGGKKQTQSSIWKYMIVVRCFLIYIIYVSITAQTCLCFLSSNLEKTIQDTKQRCMKLKFNSNISVPILTGEQIKGEGGNNLQLSLIDNCTGAIVDSVREASAQVEIVALEGDLDDDEGDAWTTEEFQSKIARDKEGKRSVLTGKLQLKLNKGNVSLSDVKFRSSQRYNGGIFKLGAWVVDTFDGGQVIEAKTKSFQVNDYRKKCK